MRTEHVVMLPPIFVNPEEVKVHHQKEIPSNRRCLIVNHRLISATSLSSREMAVIETTTKTSEEGKGATVVMKAVPSPITQHHHRPAWVNFLTGASAALSGWMFVHPFDLLKVRAQLAGEQAAANAAMASGGGGGAAMSAAKESSVSVAKIARNIVETEGVAGLYAGLSAAAARQLSYGNLRLGVYGTLRDTWYPSSSNKQPTSIEKLGMGCIAGGIAAFLSNPIEVTLIRMQADGRLPPAERRNYTNIFNGLYRIGAEDGAKAYMAGVGPTMTRAMVVNMLQVGGYDVAKTNIANVTGWNMDSIQLHLSSALAAGFVYSAATLPIDLAKTRMQNQRPTASGAMVYKSLPQTITRVASTEGVLSLWNGFLPYFARCGGHTVFMFLFLEQYRKIANKYYPSD